MEWNYYNTFIAVAPDCPVDSGTVPPDRQGGMSKPRIEYELLSEQPYTYTQKELLFEVYMRHKGLLSADEAEAVRLREEFFAKPKACMRASMLPKKYGWGIHFDEAGKAALFPVGSSAYREFAEGKKSGVKVVAAMRNKRESVPEA